MPEEEWDEEKAMRMVGGQDSVALKIENELKGAESPFDLLILTDSANYLPAKKYVLEKFGGSKIIFITLNESYAKLKKEIPGKIWKNIFVIDMISAETNVETVSAGNVEYLESPSDLTELVLQTEKKLQELEGKEKIVVLDSLSTLLVYNEPGSVEKLAHTLLAKIEAQKASTIVFSSDLDEKKDTTKTIGQFFQKTLKL